MKIQSGSNQKEKGKVVVQILKQKTQLADCQLRFIFVVVPPVLIFCNTHFLSIHCICKLLIIKYIDLQHIIYLNYVTFC